MSEIFALGERLLLPEEEIFGRIGGDAENICCWEATTSRAHRSMVLASELKTLLLIAIVTVVTAGFAIAGEDKVTGEERQRLPAGSLMDRQARSRTRSRAEAQSDIAQHALDETPQRRKKVSEKGGAPVVEEAPVDAPTTDATPSELPRNPEYHPATPEYTWSISIETSVTTFAESSEGTSTETATGKSVVALVVMPNMRGQFVEPFQPSASPFSVWAQRALVSMRQRILTRLISQFQGNFASSLVEVNSPDDIDALLELCSDLMTAGEWAGVELDGLSEMIRLLTEFRDCWRSLSENKLSRCGGSWMNLKSPHPLMLQQRPQQQPREFLWQQLHPRVDSSIP
ncbi:hypothetical protein ACLOJK_027077 [Asimina triloba]